MANEDLSTLTDAEIKEYLGYNVPTPKHDFNVHTLLSRVLDATDTIKTGNLTHEEVGILKLPVRTIKEAQLIAADITGDTLLASHLGGDAENITKTSLSKDAFFMRTSTTQTREIADKTKRVVTENKGWFKSKNKLEDHQI